MSCAETPPSSLAVRSATSAKCPSATANGACPSRAQGQARRSACARSKSKIALRAAAGGDFPASASPCRNAASSSSLHCGQDDRGCASMSGIAWRSSVGRFGYRLGASSNRLHTASHDASRSPSRSAASTAPSPSGWKPRSALQRDVNASQRCASHAALVPCASFSHTNTSRGRSSVSRRSKSSASKRFPASALTGVAASSESALDIAWRLAASRATSRPKPPSLDARNASTVQSLPFFCVQQTPRYWSSTSGRKCAGQVSAAPSACRPTPGR